MASAPLLQRARREIRTQILGMIGSGGGAGSSRAPSDAGLFGPRSSAWRVHRDVTSMMIGGVGALLLQMLHPGALAGVWDHTDFRGDMAGRLRGTARFISGTTYGSTEDAEGLIARVRAIHDKVSGALPDGTPYSANDPELLTWVHVAEVRSFLAAYLRYREPLLPPADQDRYFREMAVVARKLGAGRVPTSRAEVAEYLDAMRPRLKADERTKTVAEALLSQPAPARAIAPAYGLMMQAGVDLLPGWAAEMHGFRRPPLRRPAIALGALGVGQIVRWAMRDPATA
ncbi:oxygenase MpaB family protein [Methylopila sp. M107]|uniref:oxygenase MpaB family protein n=1 Tax=Methylopila sp. M107 TaxID=1101190 RepID=UPI00035D32CC|nr:oxygenase MpaB family protein [Methylopila sp. M107]